MKTKDQLQKEAAFERLSQEQQDAHHEKVREELIKAGLINPLEE